MKQKRRSASSLWVVLLLSFVYLPKGAQAFVETTIFLRRSATPPLTSLAVASGNRQDRKAKLDGNKKKSTTRKKKNKPRQKLLRPTQKLANNNDKSKSTGVSRPPPNLTNYQFHSSPNINENRLEAAIGCRHFGQCSGCVVDQYVADTPVLKAARLYFSSTAVRQHRSDVRRLGLPIVVDQQEAEDDWFQIVVPSPVKTWRTQAKLAVSSSASKWEPGCRLGLYRRGSHDVLPIPDCAVHHPAINKAVALIEQCTAKVGTAAFSATSVEGGLRYVQCQVDRSTGKVCLTLVWHASELKQAQPALSRLVKALQAADDSLWHSIWCHCNDGMGNAIFHRNPKRWHRLVGPEYLREPLPNEEEK